MPPCFSEGCWLGIFPRFFFCRCKAQWVHLGEKETWFEVGDLGTCDLFFNSQSSEHTVNITSSILEHPKRLPGRDLHRNFYIIYNESCYTTLDMMIPLPHPLRQPSPGSENGRKWDFARTRFCFFSPSLFPTQTPPHHQPISLTFPSLSLSIRRGNHHVVQPVRSAGRRLAAQGRVQVVLSAERIRVPAVPGRSPPAPRYNQSGPISRIAGRFFIPKGLNIRERWEIYMERKLQHRPALPARVWNSWIIRVPASMTGSFTEHTEYKAECNARISDEET